MARTREDLSNLETCERCHGLFEQGQELCSDCGKPTKYMSFKRRAEYEVEQWRSYKTPATPATPAAN
jgi:predicted amidophosphoribosyltransferase